MSSTSIYQPYTYLIKFKPTGQFYYGVKYGKGANPNLFWIKYFTSSKIIHNLIKTYGKDAFEFEIRKVFDCPQKALKHEQKVLRRLRMIDDTRFFNKAHNNSKIAASGYIFITDEVRNLVWDQLVPIPYGYRRGMKSINYNGAIGKFWVNNGKYEFMIRGDIPDMYELGRITSPTMGKTAYYNPETNNVNFYFEGEQPANFIKGNINSKKNKDCIWFSDDTNNIEVHINKFNIDKINEIISLGFREGRLKSSLDAFQKAGAMAKGAKGKIWVNNGECNTLVFPDKIPDGFSIGPLEGTRKQFSPAKRLTCPHCNYNGGGISNMERWHFDNCKMNPENTKVRIKKIAYHDINTGKRVYLYPSEEVPPNLKQGYKPQQ